MKRTKVIYNGSSQAVLIPKEFRLDTEDVSIRHEGSTIVLEPTKERSWPKGFFENIRIEDPEFRRPDQGQMPASPSFDSVSGR